MVKCLQSGFYIKALSKKCLCFHFAPIQSNLNIYYSLNFIQNNYKNGITFLCFYLHSPKVVCAQSLWSNMIPLQFIFNILWRLWFFLYFVIFMWYALSKAKLFLCYFIFWYIFIYLNLDFLVVNSSNTKHLEVRSNLEGMFIVKKDMRLHTEVNIFICYIFM